MIGHELYVYYDNSLVEEGDLNSIYLYYKCQEVSTT